MKKREQEAGKRKQASVIASESEAIQNSNIPRKIELLAPAKDKKCAFAAIDSGADAIYIGASEFGARKNAPNSLADIKDIVDYAHKFNVKVYAAINTILTDEELKKAEKLIEQLADINIDAIIIQDMGLLNTLARLKTRFVILPPHSRGRTEEGGMCEREVRGIPIHASTQCDNRTVEKVKFLEGVGFSRVVLARELSVEQIKEIKKQTNVELEVFIHGALCVSYSGQCYLSNMIGGIGGRSANRGECAQPCRKKYSLVDEDGNFIAKNKHLLCLKDFSAAEHIKELAEAGVTSFKIEGRLKDENYVRNVVAYYRKIIDELGLGKTSSGKVFLDFEPDLNKSFNRGFTDYFLERAEGEMAHENATLQTRLTRARSKNNEIYNFDTPKSMGEYIGKVSKVGKDFFEICTLTLPSPLKGEGKLLSPQDGLCFFNNSKLQGCLVNKIQNGLGPCMTPAPLEGEGMGRGDSKIARQQIFPNKMDGIKIGTEIYRNLDVEFEKKLKNSKACRKIAVNVSFGLGKISAEDEDGNFVQIDYNFEELAQNPEKMGVNIVNQFKKSGETIFYVEEVNVISDKIPFLPVSKLNELRRELLGKLDIQRCEDVKMQRCKEDQKNRSPIHPFTHSLLDYKANVLNQSAKEFYEKLGFEVVEMALEAGGNPKGKVAMTCKHCLKHAFNLCKLKNKRTSSSYASTSEIASVENSSEADILKSRNDKLYLIDEKGKRWELKFNCDRCEMEIIF